MEGEAPGTASLNSGGQTAGVSSVSCAAPGDCSAGGWYTASDGTRPAFVVTQTNGIWGTAKKVLKAGGFTAVNSVSCTTPGNCSAGGYYNGDSSREAFVVTQANGLGVPRRRSPAPRG